MNLLKKGAVGMSNACAPPTTSSNTSPDAWEDCFSPHGGA